jgi:hypothetical protein
MNGIPLTYGEFATLFIAVLTLGVVLGYMLRGRA